MISAVLRRASVRLSDRVELPAGGIDLEQLERSLVVQALERSGLEPDAGRDAARPQSRPDPLSYREVSARKEPDVAGLKACATPSLLRVASGFSRKIECRRLSSA